MNTRKLIKWFLTESGRNFSFYCAATVTIGTFFVKTIPHTFLIDNYVDIVRLYKSGVSLPMTEILKNRFEKALDLTGINPGDRKLYQPFLAYGFEIFSLGSTYSRFGCRIGLPKNFTYTSVDSIDTSIIKVNNESVPWDLEEGQQLLNALVLSENAQIYGIAREIKMSESAKLPLEIFYPSVCMIGAYGFSQRINKRFDLYVRSFAMRAFMYCLVCAFMYGNYIFAKDFTQIYFEKKIDEYLAKKDPVFIKGGKEFYEKILSRNVATRKLLGKEGESKFSALGNENFLFRNRHIPLVTRKEFFEGKSAYDEF